MENSSELARSKRPSKAPRIRAILAGGLVLGLGATITLAAWNDSEYAEGLFVSGGFNIQGSTDGTTFTDHPSTGPALLNFTANVANLSPGDVATAPFAVRLDEKSTSNAVVTMSTDKSSGELSQLTYSVTQSANFGCNEAVTGTLVAEGQLLGSTPGGVTFNLAEPQGGEAAPGAPVNLCFRITAGELLPQSQIGSTSWGFAAVSQ